jgi:hypothetical protein
LGLAAGVAGEVRVGGLAIAIHGSAGPIRVRCRALESESTILESEPTIQNKGFYAACERLGSRFRGAARVRALEPNRAAATSSIIEKKNREEAQHEAGRNH